MKTVLLSVLIVILLGCSDDDSDILKEFERKQTCEELVEQIKLCDSELVRFGSMNPNLPAYKSVKEKVEYHNTRIRELIPQYRQNGCTKDFDIADILSKYI